MLDATVAAARSVRRVLAGAGVPSLAIRGAVLAWLVIVGTAAVAVVMVLRAPERMPPAALRPSAGFPWVSEPATNTPSAAARPTYRPVAPTRPTPAGAPAGPLARAASTAVPTAATPSPVSAPPASPAPSPTPIPLGAEFAVERNGLFSYDAAVTIDNTGPSSAPEWTLVVILPRESLRMTSVEGARASQEGATWTLVPDGSAGPVPARGSIRVTFRVEGSPISSTPTACTIDGTACRGLPE
ncbi:cellulose binding domain-containing protein [Micromonospora sp. NPDC050686]|uniref:cellulose binding domain-containing protein n=1 Tax=Micromonospora sp. NPDC050686 TaxID=3154631 RepID=UPI0033DA407C